MRLDPRVANQNPRTEDIMARKFAALLGAAVIAFTALAPSVAAADPRHRGGDRGYYDNGGRGHYDDRYRGGYRHRDNDNDDALAAGVVGLVLGAVIGSALSESRRDPPRQAYYPPPPQPGYSGGYSDGPPPGYGGGYGNQGYYDNGPQLCVQRQQTWDPYARRYVTLERRVPC